MKLKLKASSLMSEKASPLGSIEDRLIRIPQKLREELGFKTGLFLHFKSKTESKIFLQVVNAYKEDINKDNTHAYISNNTFNVIEISKTSSIKQFDNILLGCDPEFFIIDKTDGKTVSANNFFPHWGEVGNDCGLAELRPRPCFMPKDVTHNLLLLMKEAKKHIDARRLYRSRPIHMLARSNLNDASAGFHIHFGLPNNLLNDTAGLKHLLYRMVNVMDYYIGIPAIMPEGNEDYQRRSARFSRYGKPGDYRTDQLTLEYRVPGGHLLRHPLLTEGILSIGALVMNDILSRFGAYSNDFSNINIFKHYKDLNEIYPNLPEKADIARSITSENINIPLHYIDKILHDLSKMLDYERLSNVILKYFEYITKYMNCNQGFSENIELNWGLSRNERQQAKMAIQ